MMIVCFAYDLCDLNIKICLLNKAAGQIIGLIGVAFRLQVFIREN